MLLALDTSTLSLSWPWWRRAGAWWSSCVVGPPPRQSDVLPGALAELPRRARRSPSRPLDGFVAGLGPGSFTGLRIGLATLKGLAYALERPLVGASSLAAVALRSRLEGVELFACAVVKKASSTWAATCGRAGGASLRWRPRVSLTVAAFADALIATPGGAGRGAGAVDYRAPLLALGVRRRSSSQGPLVPSAVALARLVTVPAASASRPSSPSSRTTSAARAPRRTRSFRRCPGSSRGRA